MPGTLTQDQIDRYRQDGYVTPVSAISAERAGALKSRYDALRALGETEATATLRSKPHLVLPWLYDLVLDPAVTEPVSAILGPNLLAWGSSFFAKPAGDPGYVTWHQDANYWGLEPHEVLTAWIAFSPSRRENGCMRMIPGSQDAGALDHRDTFAKDNLLTRGQEVAVKVDEARAVDIILEPGEMSLHHVGIVHGSEANISAIPRIGFAIRYIASHVRQIGGRTTATLARGVDEHGHFDPEPRPGADYDADGLAFRANALARQHAVLYAGAEKRPGHLRFGGNAELWIRRPRARLKRCMKSRRRGNGSHRAPSQSASRSTRRRRNVPHNAARRRRCDFYCIVDILVATTRCTTMASRSSSSGTLGETSFFQKSLW